MIEGERIRLRPARDDDWSLLEEWGQSREALWGPFQRFQLDHLTTLRRAYHETGFLTRESGILLIETIDGGHVIGFVRYSLTKFPDADFPHPEIGFVIANVNWRGKGLAQEAAGLLVTYLFSGYATERISALTDLENAAAQRVLEAQGFQREGILRRASFRDGHWRDIAIYGLLRSDTSMAEGSKPSNELDG